MAKTAVPGIEDVTGREPGGRKQRLEEGKADPAVAAFREALLSLLRGDPEVRAAVLGCVPLGQLPVGKDLEPGPVGPIRPGESDADRAKFVVDLIEAHLPRYVRPDALRRPLR